MFRVALLTTVVAVVGADSCCGTCLNGVTNFAADAMQYPACDAIQYCCFNCNAVPIGPPTILPTAGVTFDGTKVGVATGHLLQIQWPAASNVTYVSFAPNQAKTGIALTSSPAATKAAPGVFTICPQYPGTLYFRGFGSDICNSVSSETLVTLNTNSSANTDPQRKHSESYPDTNQQCHLSIVVSIRHFIITRRAKEAQRASEADEKAVEMEVMQMSPKRQSSSTDQDFVAGNASPTQSPKPKEVSL
uniref:Secreted protein n=1 Tax=Achlya hypogyna TaxID=1202772 RepID=A0A0A7CP34_ACHHY|nr:secreted protein [Achlya hypogyna]